MHGASADGDFVSIAIAHRAGLIQRITNYDAPAFDRERPNPASETEANAAPGWCSTRRHEAKSRHSAIRAAPERRNEAEIRAGNRIPETGHHQ
jgi:hypothetical protein